LEDVLPKGAVETALGTPPAHRPEVDSCLDALRDVRGDHLGIAAVIDPDAGELSRGEPPAERLAHPADLSSFQRLIGRRSIPGVIVSADEKVGGVRKLRSIAERGR